MDQQREQQLNSKLNQNWTSIKHQILEQFAQVSVADLDAATTPQDLVERIADKTHHSERFVEGRIQQLAGVGGGSGESRQGSPYGQQGGNQGQQTSDRFVTSSAMS